MKSLSGGKSPDPDRFAKAYYTTFLPLLSRPTCSYFNSITGGSQIRLEALLAHITVFPKERKDLILPQNYRPKSLLNADIKILAKILTNRLKGVPSRLFFLLWPLNLSSTVQVNPDIRGLDVLFHLMDPWSRCLT